MGPDPFASRGVNSPGRSGAKPHWRRDPLLAVARLVMLLGMAATGVLAVMFALAAPAILIFNAAVMDFLVSRGGPPESLWGIINVAALSAVMAALSYLFFRHLYRIIGSVEEGDPFVPVNADRLHAMGWIAVAVHVLGIPMAMTSHWLEEIFQRPQRDFEFSVFGLVLAIVLFVLARVFREGARLREELEGTV
jgi:hypothetical protein